MRSTIFLLAVFVVSPLYAQITHSVRTVQTIEGASPDNIVSGFLILESEEPPKIKQARVLELSGGDNYSIAIDAELSDRSPVATAEIGDKQYLVFSTQKTWVTLFCTDFDAKRNRIQKIQLEGEEPPIPPPPPPPDDCNNIPEDEFDNVGRKSCKSLSLLTAEERSKQKAVDQAYLDTVKAMDNVDTSGVLSLNDAQEYLGKKLRAAIGPSPGNWRKWLEAVNDHIAGMEFTRYSFKMLCQSIAEGL